MSDLRSFHSSEENIKSRQGRVAWSCLDRSVGVRAGCPAAAPSQIFIEGTGDETALAWRLFQFGFTRVAATGLRGKSEGEADRSLHARRRERSIR